MRWPLVLYFIGIFMLPVGAVAIVNDHPRMATFAFTVPSGQYYYFQLHVSNGGLVSGSFVEAQGLPLAVYVLDQQQYDAYQAFRTSTSLFSATNLSQGTYKASIPAPGNYYIVLDHALGYYSTPEQVSLIVRVDGINLPYQVLESLAPIGAGLLVFAFFLRRRENRRFVSSLLKQYPNVGLGEGEDDSQILGIAQNLCQQLHLAFNPIAVYWIVWVKMGGIRAAPSDRCFPGVKGARRGYLHLPAALRGRLESGEWTALIASSLIWLFQPELKRKRRRLNRLWRLTILASIGLVVLVFWFLNTFAPLNYPIGFVANYPPLLLAFLIAMVPITILARKINLTYQKYCLEADKVAAEVVGKTQLIQILRKIDSMGLSDIEMRKKESDRIWKRDGVSPWPSISARIQSLATS
jgi:hypothetical protein